MNYNIKKIKKMDSNNSLIIKANCTFLNTKGILSLDKKKFLNF